MPQLTKLLLGLIFFKRCHTRRLFSNWPSWWKMSAWMQRPWNIIDFIKYHWDYSCPWDCFGCRRNQCGCRHLGSLWDTTSALFGDLLKPLLGCVTSTETLPWKDIFRRFPNHVTWVADIWWHLRSKNLFLSQVRLVPKLWEPKAALDSHKLLIWPVQAWLIWRESKIAQVDSPTDMIVEFQRKLV